jgi:hypothetical protein
VAKKEAKAVEVIAKRKGYGPRHPGGDDEVILRGEKFVCAADKLSAKWMSRVDGEEIVPVERVNRVLAKAQGTAADGEALKELESTAKLQAKALGDKDAEIEKLKAELEAAKKKD